MRVLVTGGAGYIGSHACKALAAAGHEPIVFDNLSTGNRWAVRWGPLVEADLANTGSIQATLAEYRPRAVMHFAASAYVGESAAEPRKYFRNNVVNTLNLLDSMIDRGVRMFLFSSTCATYGNPSVIPILESHPQWPVNPYGESKLFIERVLKWYQSAYGLRPLTLRYFNAAGADMDGEIGEEHEPETHLIPLAIRAALGRGKPLNIFGKDYPTPDGTCIRDYIHVQDLADAHVKALQLLDASGVTAPTACNLGTGQGYSVLEVVRAVEDVCGARVHLGFSARRAGDPPILIAGTDGARSLGWQPRLSTLTKIIESSWRWFAKRSPAGGAVAAGPSTTLI
jgi:UDP-glucose-4-epimerase GalE